MDNLEQVQKQLAELAARAAGARAHGAGNDDSGCDVAMAASADRESLPGTKRNRFPIQRSDWKSERTTPGAQLRNCPNNFALCEGQEDAGRPLHNSGQATGVDSLGACLEPEAGTAGRVGDPPLHGGGDGDSEELPTPPAVMPVYMKNEDWQRMQFEAAKGVLPGPELSAAQRMLYFALMGLYFAQRCGAIPLPIAKVEKRLAVEAYNSHEKDRYLVMHSGEFFKNVEQACTAFAKDKSYKSAKAMYQAVYGMLPGNANAE